MIPGMFSGLDLEQPRDKELVANLPRHIRETRRALSNIKVLRVEFEAGVERGDLVFPDGATGTWLRSHGSLPERRKFFGIAFPEDSAVVVGATALCPDWGWHPGKFLFLHPTKYGKMTHTEPDNPIRAGYALTGELMILNIFEASWYDFITDFKNWVTQESIEIQELKAYLTEMADKVISIEGLIDEVWKSLQDTEANLLPRIEALKGIFGAANMFAIEVSTAMAIGGIVTVPSYNYQYSNLFLLFNGVASVEWEKMPPILGEFSTRIKMKAAIPANTQIIGIIFTEAYNVVVPETVITNETLDGGGTIAAPLGVSANITQALTSVQTDVTNIKNNLVPERVFVSDASVITGNTTGSLQLKTLSILGDTGQLTRIFPIANTTAAGLMPATMYNKVLELVDQYDALTGITRRIVDDTLPKEATSAQLYASWAKAGITLVEGATIENLALGFRWTYRNGNWHGPYETLGISIATSTNAGIVKSVEITDENTGKVYVEVGGTMSVVGYDALRQVVADNYNTVQIIANRASKLWTRSVDINLPYVAGTAIVVPNYTPKSGMLNVYLNGVRTDLFKEDTAITISLSVGILGSGSAQLLIDCFRSGLDTDTVADVIKRLVNIEAWKITQEEWKVIQGTVNNAQGVWNVEQEAWNTAQEARINTLEDTTLALPAGTQAVAGILKMATDSELTVSNVTMPPTAGQVASIYTRVATLEGAEANTTVLGRIRTATDAIITDGTDRTRAVVPAQLAATNTYIAAVAGTIADLTARIAALEAKQGV